MRAAEVANATGCSVEIKVGSAVYTIVPAKGGASTSRENGIDYSRPRL